MTAEVCGDLPQTSAQVGWPDFGDERSLIYQSLINSQIAYSPSYLALHRS